MPFEIFAYTVKFCKPSFGKTPKTFYTVDVSAAMCKFVLSVINPQMLTITHINQSAIPTPTIRIDDAVQADFTQYSQGIQKSYTKAYGILKRLQTNDIRQAGIRS